MNNIFSSIFLGFIQGITEFVPISSSGHLIVFRDLINIQSNYGLAFDSVLQLATTFAILIYFRKDIKNLVFNFLKIISGKDIRKEDRNMIKALITGTIPAVVLGIFFEDIMDTLFRSSFLVALSLVVGGVIMILSEKFNKEHNTTIPPLKSLVIGFFQALALIPGMSRSGMTISGGLFMNLNRELATRFSFILALPVLLGSGLKKLFELNSLGYLNEIGTELFIGTLVSFVVGMLVIHFLIKYLKNHSLKVFAYYRFILAILIIIFLI
jgi:undecaprenyl-diphosphatase